MKKAIRDYIISHPPISAIINDGVYSFPAPQGSEYPYITIHRLDEQPERYLNQPSNRYPEDWQLDIFASTDLLADELKALVIERLDVCTPIDLGLFTVYNMFVVSSSDLSELELDGSEKRIARKNINIRLIRNKVKN